MTGHGDKLPPKPEKILKAFEVSEDFHIGQRDIVWATCHAAARRAMMGEWDMEFNQVKAKHRPRSGRKGPGFLCTTEI